ncbi:hypothetical protein DTV46_02885 [Salmonella enterica subsp. salamae]|nr:hypothetical protein [Salmonella enterica subsp. salamae]
MAFPRAEPSAAVIVSLLSKTPLEISLVSILVFNSHHGFVDIVISPAVILPGALNVRITFS